MIPGSCATIACTVPSRSAYRLISGPASKRRIFTWPLLTGLL